jgi:acyl-CoA dehydrogenase
MGDNEAAKHKAAKLLQQGEIFAFGLSEKEHGADIYSSEMMLHPQADGSYLASGDKYYIGNGNKAAMVSTFAKVTGTYSRAVRRRLLSPGGDEAVCPARL